MHSAAEQLPPPVYAAVDLQPPRGHPQPAAGPHYQEEDETQSSGRESPEPPLPPCARFDMDCDLEPDVNKTEVLSMEKLVYLWTALGQRHHLSKTCMSHILKLLKIMTPGMMPSSMYFLKKYAMFMNRIERHFICSRCETYLGKVVPRNCPFVQCGIILYEKRLLKLGKYFLYSPLCYQIRDILESGTVPINLTCKKTLVSSEVITDAIDGMGYKRLHSKHQQNVKCLTAAFNYDGVQVSHSSLAQIYPIQCKILEIPKEIRDSFIMIPLLWFARSKPPTQAVFKPFVEEMRELGTVGMTYVDEHDVEQIVLVMTGFSSCDAIARADVRNVKRFNAEHGCEFCLHPGGRHYPYCRRDEVLRTDAGFVDDAIKGTDKKPVHGAKGPCELMSIPNFGMVSHFVAEYQHGSCLGVCKTLFKYWLHPNYSNRPWYLGDRIEELSELLQIICVPNEITRIPRSLNLYKKFKANEWRSILLYFGVPILKNFLPKKYYDHFCLFAFGISLLNKDQISQQEINCAELALTKFVYTFGSLYHDSMVTYNIHCLIHLPEGVRNWGPLHVTSTFPYESKNGFLKNAFQGTMWVGEQIMESCMHELAFVVRESLFSNCGDDVLELYKLLASSHKQPALKQVITTKLKVLGYSCEFMLTIEQVTMLQQMLHSPIINKLSLKFNSFILKKVFVSSADDIDRKRRNDVISFAGNFYSVKGICMVRACDCVAASCACKFVPVIMAKLLSKRVSTLFRDASVDIASNSIFEVDLTNNNIYFFPITIEIKKCVFLQVYNKNFAIAICNTFESD